MERLTGIMELMAEALDCNPSNLPEIMLLVRVSCRQH